MKRIILLTLSICCLSLCEALTVHLTTPGTLADLTHSDTITQLTVTGVIDHTDIAYISSNALASLHTVDLSGASLTALKYNSFKDCTHLESIILPNNLKSIGSESFSNCTNLASITLPDSLIRIDPLAFNMCTSLKSIILPNTMTEDIWSLFPHCTSLENITLHTTLLRLEDHTFWDCTSLKTIILPSSLTYIGERIFYNCTKLDSVVIPNSITSICGNAFDHCTGLEHIILPNTLTYMGDEAFNNCTSLDSITLPSSLTSLSFASFANCSSLVHVSLSNSFTSISEMAFASCTSLTNITLPNSLTSIDYFAFSDCIKLNGSITIPSKVTKIAPGAFLACSNIDTLVLSQDISSIEDSAFAEASQLRYISVPTVDPPTITATTFRGVNKGMCILDVPKGSKTKYQTADYWSEFFYYSDEYPLSINIGDHGSIQAGDTVVSNGSVLMLDSASTTTFTITPEQGYEIASLNYGSKDILPELTNNTYTTPEATGRVELSVTFRLSEYQLTISNSLTGDSEQTYHYGDTPSFDLTPSEGLHISSVVYNGTNVTTSLIEHTYTTPPIVDHSELSVNYSTTTSVDLTTKEHSISIRVHTSDIDICGTQQGDRVDIFALNGKRIQSCIANGEDVKFTLTNHKMCIVRVGQSAFKVIL